MYALLVGSPGWYLCSRPSGRIALEKGGKSSDLPSGPPPGSGIDGHDLGGFRSPRDKLMTGPGTRPDSPRSATRIDRGMTPYYQVNRPDSAGTTRVALCGYEMEESKYELIIIRNDHDRGRRSHSKRIAPGIGQNSRRGQVGRFPFLGVALRGFGHCAKGRHGSCSLASIPSVTGVFFRIAQASWTNHRSAARSSGWPGLNPAWKWAATW
jgi:hypothetical protein